MRASRLLSILLMLQTRGRLTADQLAATFEVSVRTVYRDIEQLSAAGVPVYADRGPGGGFQLLDGFRTKLTGLTEHEAESLFLSGLPGPATQLGLADQLLSAQLKLTAALPERSRAGAQKIAQRFHLDPVDWFRTRVELREGVVGHHGTVADFSGDFIVPVIQRLTFSVSPRFTWESTQPTAPYLASTPCRRWLQCCRSSMPRAERIRTVPVPDWS